jgi:hypothetical protein
MRKAKMISILTVLIGASPCAVLAQPTACTEADARVTNGSAEETKDGVWVRFSVVGNSGNLAEARVLLSRKETLTVPLESEVPGFVVRLRRVEAPTGSQELVATVAWCKELPLGEHFLKVRPLSSPTFLQRV